MPSPQYAVVAYVTNTLGRFVEDLRREVHPEHGHLAAHVSILAPRQIRGNEGEAEALLRRLCRDIQPFEVVLGEVESFVPTTPTVFIRVAHGAYRMRELHDLLNTGALAGQEQWPYMPHLTIAKLPTMERAREVFAASQEGWAEFREPRRILIDQLTFVRQSENGDWVDIAPVRLGEKLTPIQR